MKHCVHLKFKLLLWGKDYYYCCFCEKKSTILVKADKNHGKYYEYGIEYNPLYDEECEVRKED